MIESKPSVTARRVAEGAVADSVAHGVRQYVVLGAGLDTFAYGNPYPELRVFDVDFPSTQTWKRERLAAGDIALPESLTFAPIDFAPLARRERIEDLGQAELDARFFTGRSDGLRAGTAGHILTACA